MPGMGRSAADSLTPSGINQLRQRASPKKFFATEDGRLRKTEDFSFPEKVTGYQATSNRAIYQAAGYPVAGFENQLPASSTKPWLNRVAQISE